MKKHKYSSQLIWTGNKGHGTSSYSSYDRSFITQSLSKPLLYGSSDPSFYGDKSKYNPEELFVMSIASCHMLWYLHLCAEANITVVSYEDATEGSMSEKTDGTGSFSIVILNPIVKILEKDQTRLANELHQKANKMCFIANSCNFPIVHLPKTFNGK